MTCTEVHTPTPTPTMRYNPNMKHRKSKFKVVGLLVAGLALMGILSSCSDDYATSTSDSHICVFDGSERGGQKLKFQVSPGAESKKIDENDTVVKIPASNRFFMASVNRKVSADGATWEFSPNPTKDPLAPDFYKGFAKGNVPVHVEGQVRFKFNLNKACEWYSKHGRRNADSEGDLGFNARGGEAEAAGWFKFLTENFGVTMQEVTSERIGTFNPKSMVFNYPANADENGTVPEGKDPGEATNIALGDVLGETFTERLNANLGGDYFCGIDDTGDDPCPPMRFQVTAVHTADPALEASWTELETTRTRLENEKAEGKLQEEQQDALIKAEKAKQAALQEQLITAQIEADIKNAPCVPLAKLGLDCEGHHAPVIAGNG